MVTYLFSFVSCQVGYYLSSRKLDFVVFCCFIRTLNPSVVILRVATQEV